MCPSLFFFYHEDSSCMRLGPTIMTLFYLNHLFKDSVSTYSHGLRNYGLGPQHRKFWRHKSAHKHTSCIADSPFPPGSVLIIQHSWKLIPFAWNGRSASLTGPALPSWSSNVGIFRKCFDSNHKEFILASRPQGSLLTSVTEQQFYIILHNIHNLYNPTGLGQVLAGAQEITWRTALNAS